MKKAENEMNKRAGIPAPVGGSSLLVIFAVLCLTVFALLGLATVTADKRLADKHYEAVRAYYKADEEAERTLGEIRHGNVPSDVTVEGNRYSYSCAMSDTQELCVVVEVEGDTYSVLQWKVAQTKEWVPDESMNLLEIEDMEGLMDVDEWD